ncbi:hypothetical protein EDD17DRAFT_1834602, partial [Pisolithus thermaeus]
MSVSTDYTPSQSDGPPKSGKTNFIDQLTGTKGKRAAHQVESHTQGIMEFTVNLSNDQQYVFAEIPGFNDPCRLDWEILRTSAEWLIRSPTHRRENRYRTNVKLNGIIYTHCIADNWMSGPVCKNLELFSRLCGDKAAGGVRLVTTMWDQVTHKELAEMRVWQLENNFWRPLIEEGARHERFEENSSSCAWGIIKSLTGEGEALLLQEELVDARRRLSETIVGRALYGQCQKLSPMVSSPCAASTSNRPLFSRSSRYPDFAFFT